MEGYEVRYDCETDCAEPAASTHIESADDIAIARAWLISMVFGGGLPTGTGTLSSVTSPITLTGVATCQKITFAFSSAEPRLWTPNSTNGDLVLIHGGHEMAYDDLDMDVVIQQLIDAGFTVCGFVMPGGSATVGGNTGSHNGLSLSVFMLPIIGAINTLEGSYTNIYMTGLSGGGWSTTLAAALDTRIKKSYPIAGSLPLYMPMTGAAGTRDAEQLLPGISGISYLDLYLLGACPNRRQKQILHDGDTCCFSKSMYDELSKPYATFIANLATDCGGDYDLVFKVLADHRFDATIFSAEVLSEI